MNYVFLLLIKIQIRRSCMISLQLKEEQWKQTQITSVQR